MKSTGCSIFDHRAMVLSRFQAFQIAASASVFSVNATRRLHLCKDQAELCKRAGPVPFHPSPGSRVSRQHVKYELIELKIIVVARFR